VLGEELTFGLVKSDERAIALEGALVRNSSTAAKRPSVLMTDGTLSGRPVRRRRVAMVDHPVAIAIGRQCAGAPLEGQSVLERRLQRGGQLEHSLLYDMKLKYEPSATDALA